MSGADLSAVGFTTVQSTIQQHFDIWKFYTVLFHDYYS